jgi:hypothetical protein
MNIATKEKVGRKRVISADRDESPCRTTETSDKFSAVLTAFSEEFMLKSKPEGFDAVAEFIHERRKA